jgi:hypothetical protein
MRDKVEKRNENAQLRKSQQIWGGKKIRIAELRRGKYFRGFIVYESVARVH